MRRSPHRSWSWIGVAALGAALAGPAAAQHRPEDGSGPPRLGTTCLYGDGAIRAPACRRLSGSRLHPEGDICQCPGDTRQLRAPFCERGERSLPDDAATVAARFAAARTGDGVLEGGVVGRRFCLSRSINGS